MSDTELQILYRRALDDPSLRPIYLQFCERMGKSPTDTISLSWELEQLDLQEQRLKENQKDFCYRYIENLLRIKKVPHLIIETQDGRGFSWGNYDQLFFYDDEKDEDTLRIFEESCPQEDTIIMRHLDLFHNVFGEFLSLKFEIVENNFKVFDRQQNIDGLFSWIETQKR